MPESVVNRRKFLLQFTGLGCVSALVSVASSCNSSQPEKASVPDITVKNCDDLSEVDEIELTKRKSLGYVDSSPMPDKNCENCGLYLPPREGRNCGGCLLFTGPVLLEGYCTYWAEVVQEEESLP